MDREIKAKISRGGKSVPKPLHPDDNPFHELECELNALAKAILSDRAEGFGPSFKLQAMAAKILNAAGEPLCLCAWPGHMENCNLEKEILK